MRSVSAPEYIRSRNRQNRNQRKLMNENDHSIHCFFQRTPSRPTKHATSMDTGSTAGSTAE